jgi:hypothetical protein
MRPDGRLTLGGVILLRAARTRFLLRRSWHSNWLVKVKSAWPAGRPES